MQENLEARVRAIIHRMRENPVHMYAMQRRSAEIVEKVQKGEIKLPQDTPGFWQMNEYSFFEEDEDICVYLDFRNQVFSRADSLDKTKSHFKEYLHSHEFFELFYVYSGTCHCYFDGREFRLPKGTIWIFNTQCAHNVYLPDDRTNLVNILLRKSTFSAALLGMINDNDLFLSFFLNSIYNSDSAPKQLQFTTEPGGMSEFYIFKIIEEYAGKSPYSQSIMKHLFCCLLAELTRQYRERADNRGRESGLHISQVISYISNNYRTATLQSTAEHFHYNPSYLSKYMLKHTNQTFSEYLTRFKLEKAAHLLTSTALPLERVASLTGYSERSAFDKAFKKFSGLTPRQYRSQKQAAPLVPQEATR